jgi:hypothetical protein
LHGDRADPGLHQAFGTVAVANHAVAPVRQVLGFHRGEEGLGFRFDRLRQQPAGAAAQNRRERVVNRVGLTQGNNAVKTRHGVSLLREVQAGFHPPRYAAFLNQPSPRFHHSSVTMTRD